MAVADPGKIRDYVLLVILGRILSRIGHRLADYENIGVDYSADDPSTPQSAETAIEQVRELSDDECRCHLLASGLASVDFKRQLLILLNELSEAVCKADVPAELALMDGSADDAVSICSDAFCDALGRCGPKVDRLAAEYLAEAELLFPRGCKTEEVVEVFGFCPFSDKNLGTIPTVELEELLGLDNDATGETMGTSPNIVHPDEEEGDSGRWRIDPGVAVFDGQRYEINKQPMRVLEKFLVTRKHSLGYDDLRPILDKDGLIGNPTIRSHLKDLRSSLREIAKDAHLDESIIEDPIPFKNGGWQFLLPR